MQFKTLHPIYFISGMIVSLPLIGLTTRSMQHPELDIPFLSSPRSYIDALIRAGAIPVMIPISLPKASIQTILARLDGVLFSGGGDIDPKIYNGETHSKIYGIDPERDEIEIELVSQVASKRKPFLAICRGLQVVNVALGGTLYTHLSDQFDKPIQHACYPDHPWDHIAHPIKITQGSLLGRIMSKQEIEVNSLHHQGVKKIGKGLDVVATAPDGLVEGLELRGHVFGLAVQWHPETMPDSIDMQKIFEYFVNAAARG